MSNNRDRERNRVAGCFSLSISGLYCLGVFRKGNSIKSMITDHSLLRLSGKSFPCIESLYNWHFLLNLSNKRTRFGTRSMQSTINVPQRLRQGNMKLNSGQFMFDLSTLLPSSRSLTS